MTRGLRILILVLLGACAEPPKPPPLVLAHDADLKPLVGKRVEVRGYLRTDRYKGFPGLYATLTKEKAPAFYVYLPDSIEWRSRVKQELVMVGVVDELPPFTEEQRKPENVPQGYPDGVLFIRVETVEDATSR